MRPFKLVHELNWLIDLLGPTITLMDNRRQKREIYTIATIWVGIVAICHLKWLNLFATQVKFFCPKSCTTYFDIAHLFRGSHAKQVKLLEMKMESVSGRLDFATNWCGNVTHLLFGGSNLQQGLYSRWYWYNFPKKEKNEGKRNQFPPHTSKRLYRFGRKRVLVRLKGVLRCALLCNLWMALLSLFFILPSDAWWKILQLGSIYGGDVPFI